MEDMIQIGWAINGWSLRRGFERRIYPTENIANRYAKKRGAVAVPVWVRKEDQ